MNHTGPFHPGSKYIHHLRFLLNRDREVNKPAHRQKTFSFRQFH